MTTIDPRAPLNHRVVVAALLHSDLEPPMQVEVKFVLPCHTAEDSAAYVTDLLRDNAELTLLAVLRCEPVPIPARAD